MKNESEPGLTCGSENRLTFSQRTRTLGFHRSPSGHQSARGYVCSITTPISRHCIYQNASGRSRWLNRDPIGERGGINLYEFVENNPPHFVDTDGNGAKSSGNAPVKDPVDTSLPPIGSGSSSASAAAGALDLVTAPLDDPRGPGLIATICAALGKHPFDKPVFNIPWNPVPDQGGPYNPPNPLPETPPTPVAGGQPYAPPATGCSLCPVNNPAIHR